MTIGPSQSCHLRAYRQVGGDPEVLGCGHAFHGRCITLWAAHCDRKALPLTAGRYRRESVQKVLDYQTQSNGTIDTTKTIIQQSPKPTAEWLHWAYRPPMRRVVVVMVQAAYHAAAERRQHRRAKRRRRRRKGGVAVAEAGEGKARPLGGQRCYSREHGLCCLWWWCW